MLNKILIFTFMNEYCDHFVVGSCLRLFTILKVPGIFTAFMMNKSFLFSILISISTYLDLSTSVNIECTFNPSNWTIVKDSYRCNINKNPWITRCESAQVNLVTGKHEDGMTNNDVSSLRAHAKTINYFPQGLENFFKNLKVISIDKCQLKEIHQADLKPFTKLVELILHHNQIVVLEEGLFDYNLELELIWLNYNKIKQIDPNVFDKLNKFRYFLFSSNFCSSKDVYNSRDSVKDAVKLAKVNCVGSEKKRILRK
ncbi:hypothetical protein ACKWTF_003202 [Chironomus riparius]